MYNHKCKLLSLFSYFSCFGGNMSLSGFPPSLISSDLMGICCLQFPHLLTFFLIQWEKVVRNLPTSSLFSHISGNSSSSIFPHPHSFLILVVKGRPQPSHILTLFSYQWEKVVRNLPTSSLFSYISGKRSSATFPHLHLFPKLVGTDQLQTYRLTLTTPTGIGLIIRIVANNIR